MGNELGLIPAQEVRGVMFAWRMLQHVRRTRVAIENRLRSANLCLYCGGKRKPKSNHSPCSLCSPEICGHCEGTGKADVELPQELLAEFGMNVEQLRTAERMLQGHVLRIARRHPDWNALMAVAQRWPGVGEVLLAALLGLVGDLRRFPTHRHFCRYMGIAVDSHGRAMRRYRGVAARWSSAGRSWCYLVMEQWLRWGRQPPGWEEMVAYEESKNPQRAKVRAARKLVQQLLTELWRAINQPHAMIIAREVNPDDHRN